MEIRRTTKRSTAHEEETLTSPVESTGPISCPTVAVKRAREGGIHGVGTVEARVAHLHEKQGPESRSCMAKLAFELLDIASAKTGYMASCLLYELCIATDSTYLHCKQDDKLTICGPVVKTNQPSSCVAL